MQILKITEYTMQLNESINRFLKLLTGRVHMISRDSLVQIIDNKMTSLFVLVDEQGRERGMLTLACYSSPWGKKAWIEDVVVDEGFRGKGWGRKLIEHAIQEAKDQKVDVVMLTSNPKRIAANKLYQSMEFDQKETNVYVKVLDHSLKK